jgi:preprotein translocase subunit SecF
MIDVVNKRLWYFIISGVLLVIAVVGLGAFGLKPGIEFSSGSVLNVSFTQTVVQADLKQALSTAGYSEAIVQEIGEEGKGNFLIRIHEINNNEKTALESTLANQFGQINESSFDSISPAVASETVRNTVIAVVVALVGIMLYILWAFRKMPKPFRYSVSAIIALAHDVLIAAGLFALAGFFLGWEVDLMFITGILSIVGYSINNTVVVFDRIRENQHRGVSYDYSVVVNNSMVETMGRCLNSSITTLIAIAALMFFVGGSIESFLVVLMIGVIVGIFTSIFVAPTILVAWETGVVGKAKPEAVVAKAKA